MLVVPAAGGFRAPAPRAALEYMAVMQNAIEHGGDRCHISRVDVLVIDDWAMAHSRNLSAGISGRSVKSAIKCALRS
jgi:hypothetical protein